jgi:hypothetical protein
MTDEIRKLTDAVLYEGYVLWPYRRSAFKNQQRWTFGVVFPPRHSAEHPDDRASFQAQCLVEADETPEIETHVRFLHVVERRLERNGEFVDQVTVGGTSYLSWDEATERELLAGHGRHDIVISAGHEAEQLQEGTKIVRTWEELRGRVTVETERIGERLFRVTVQVANEAPWQGSERKDALRRAFCSTHVVLHANEGAFVSLTDPPAELRAAARNCDNIGLWPVLVGAEGERHTLLASPIILSDYPQIAPESPGDLFDSGEIDRLLILNVLSLSEAEQEEMRATDPRAREILERCDALGPDELLPLHGVIRDLRPAQ